MELLLLYVYTITLKRHHWFHRYRVLDKQPDAKQPNRLVSNWWLIERWCYHESSKAYSEHSAKAKEPESNSKGYER